MLVKTITSSAVQDKTVLVRVDFNVPLTEDETPKVADDSRIQASLETITFLRQHNAKIVLMSHLGRPKGKPVPKLSLAPVAHHLSKLLNTEVKFAPETIADETTQLVESLQPGEIVLLENLRFQPEEKKNSDAFAKKLAAYADVYVNEAFSTSHRKHTSIEAITHHLPAFAGFALTNEVEHLSRLMSEPKRPFVMVIGGAKISDKVEAVVNLASIADVVLVGGGVANNFLKAEGIDIAKSYLQDTPADEKKEHINYVDVAEDLIDETRNQRILLNGYVPLPKIIYPSDVIAAPSPDSKKAETVVLANGHLEEKHQQNLMYLDIGPKTQKLFKELILQAGTVFWNGPMGVFEKEPFAEGTKEIARAIAKSGATTILGGGDTIAAIQAFNLTDRFDYVSAAGGAALDFLAGKSLPGLKPLQS